MHRSTRRRCSLGSGPFLTVAQQLCPRYLNLKYRPLPIMDSSPQNNKENNKEILEPFRFFVFSRGTGLDIEHIVHDGFDPELELPFPSHGRRRRCSGLGVTHSPREVGGW